MINYICLRLEEKYLDSFLYSGNLFLLGVDGVITTYDWSALVSRAMEMHGGSELAHHFLDSRIAKYFPIGHPIDVHIPSRLLKEFERDKLRWNVWPTDINVYANKLFISDESGISVVGVEYKTGRINAGDVRRIKSGYVYSISPGDGGRLAAAGVEDGLSMLVYESRSKYSSKVLVPEDVVDCDWFGSDLVANSRSHAYVSRFEPLPLKSDYPDRSEYKAKYNETLHQQPEVEKIDLEGSSAYVWLTGAGVVKDAAEKLGESKVVRSRIVRARAASFGSVVEYGDHVALMRSDGTCDLDVPRPIFWRTFSRSKNYLNQLHICNDDGLQIRAYLVQPAASDKFAISLTDVDDRRP